MPKDPVCIAVHRLRQVYGDSQQQFAERIGVGLRTMARYETEQPPRGLILGKLSRLAKQKNQHDLAAFFLEQIIGTLEGPSRQPRTEEEAVWVAALLEVMRHPILVDNSAWSDIQDKLVYWLRKIRDAAELQSSPQLEEIERLNAALVDCTEQLARRAIERRVGEHLSRLQARGEFDQTYLQFEDLWKHVFSVFRRDSLSWLSKAEFIIGQALGESDSRDLLAIRRALRELDITIGGMGERNDKWSKSIEKIMEFFGLRRLPLRPLKVGDPRLS